MLKRNGTYYLVYSGNSAASWRYRIGYATSDSPTGPFIKHDGNPISVPAAGVWGPGSGAIVPGPAGDLWMVYHQKKLPSDGWARFICIDAVVVEGNGDMRMDATRGTLLPAP